MKLTKTELEQLLSYCRQIEDTGVYYGNQDHFNYRHKNIIVFVEQEIKKAVDKKTKL